MTETINQTTPEPAAIIERDGYLVNSETGEVVGIIDEPRDLIEVGMDLDSANWVLRKMQAEKVSIDVMTLNYNEAGKAYDALIDAAIQAAASTEEARLLSARIANLSRNIDRRKSRLGFLMARYKDQLGFFARKALSGTKSKTWHSEAGFGSVQVKKTQPKAAILDDQRAVKLAKELGLHLAIKESVNASDLKPIFVQAYSDLPKDADAEVVSKTAQLLHTIYANPGAIDFKPASEEVIIDLGA